MVRSRQGRRRVSKLGWGFGVDLMTRDNHVSTRFSVFSAIVILSLHDLVWSHCFAVDQPVFYSLAHVVEWTDDLAVIDVCLDDSVDHVFAFEPSSGQLLWQQSCSLAGNGRLSVSSSGVMCIPDSNTVACVDARTGETKWRQTISPTYKNDSKSTNQSRSDTQQKERAQRWLRQAVVFSDCVAILQMKVEQGRGTLGLCSVEQRQDLLDLQTGARRSTCEADFVAATTNGIIVWKNDALRILDKTGKLAEFPRFSNSVQTVLKPWDSGVSSWLRTGPEPSGNCLLWLTTTTGNLACVYDSACRTARVVGLREPGNDGAWTEWCVTKEYIIQTSSEDGYSVYDLSGNCVTNARPWSGDSLAVELLRVNGGCAEPRLFVSIRGKDRTDAMIITIPFQMGCAWTTPLLSSSERIGAMHVRSGNREFADAVLFAYVEKEPGAESSVRVTTRAVEVYGAKERWSAAFRVNHSGVQVVDHEVRGSRGHPESAD